MGTGVVIGAALVGAGVSAISGHLQGKKREEQAAEAHQRVKTLIKEQRSQNKTNRNIALNDISRKREQADFQLGQSEDQADRALDTLSFQLDSARDQFSQRLGAVHRSQIRSTEKIYRKHANQKSEAAASGVRGGGAIDTVMSDRDDAREDLQFAVEQERQTMDRKLSGVERQVSDQELEIQAKLDQVRFGHEQMQEQLADAKTKVHSTYNANEAQLDYNRDESKANKEAAEYSVWHDTIAPGIQGGMSGLSLGINLNNIGSDLNWFGGGGKNPNSKPGSLPATSENPMPFPSAPAMELNLDENMFFNS